MCERASQLYVENDDVDDGEKKEKKKNADEEEKERVRITEPALIRDFGGNYL